MPDDSSTRSDRLPSPSPIEIDARIDRLSRRAEEDLPETVFYQELLAELVEATAAVGAAIWREEDQAFRLAAQIHLSHLAAESDGQEPRRQAALRDVLSSGQSRHLQVGWPPSGSHSEDAALLLVPWRASPDLAGVLETQLREGLSERALAGQARFVHVTADLLAVYHRHRQFSLLQQCDRLWQSIDHFARAIHRASHLVPTAYEIVNEGRQLIQCDRVTLLVRRRRHWQVVAVSGADTANRRSATLSRLERLAAAVASLPEPLWYAEHADEAKNSPPEIEEPLHDYLDLASVRLAGFYPLISDATSADRERSAAEDASDKSPFGMLVIEHFDRRDPEEFRERAAAVCRHAAPAVRHALDLESLPLYRLSHFLNETRWLRRWARQPRTLLIAGAVAVLLAILSVTPATLWVEAGGALQPETRRNVFAPADGIVERIFMHQAGKKVGKGEPLLGLRNLQLEYETQRLLGELETSQKQLSSIEAERLSAGRTNREDLRESTRRAAEEETLKKKIEGLSREHALLVKLQDQLQIASPIDGEVLTWDVENLLESRPVVRGQMLMTIADLRGAWVVELRIPDDRIAHVASALRSSRQPLGARFILATSPERRYLGRLERVSPATDVLGSDAPTVSAIVRPEDQAAMKSLRPGATVVAKIDCGRRSVLYVGFHGLVHVIRSRLLF